MTSKRILHILAALAAAATAVGAADLAGISSILPEGWAALVATLPPVAATVAHFAIALGDQLDDGKKNNSFPRRD